MSTPSPSKGISTLPGHGQGAVQRSGFPRPHGPVSGQFDQLGGSCRRSSIMCRRRRLGRARPAGRFQRAVGNFGNVFAAWRGRMGRFPPAGRLNRNDILTRFFDSGTMAIHGVEPSVTSMDIQVSSNFERLLFDLMDRDGAAVAATSNASARTVISRSARANWPKRAACSMATRSMTTPFWRASAPPAPPPAR